MSGAFVLTILLAFSVGCVREPEPKVTLDKIESYVNAYEDFDTEDIWDLQSFDIAVIEPYYAPSTGFVRDLQTTTITLAYVSIGEADNERRYWDTWRPTDRAPDNPAIPRTTLTPDDTIFIAEDPGWEGSYFVDASNPRWRDILINEEIPYILWLGDGHYDGLMMDLVDVVDEYEGLEREAEMRQGLIDLIACIDSAFPDLILVPNRGFGVLPEMVPYIDAFKFEEMTGAYGNIEDEDHFGEYYLKVDDEGERENDDEIEILLSALQQYPMPVLVLDHVPTDPPDRRMAKECYKICSEFAEENNLHCVWYGNSVDQDLYIWPFLDLRRR